MNKLKSIFTYLFLGIVTLFSLFPFAWMVIASTNKSVDVTLGKLTPGNQFFTNLQTLFDTIDYGSAFINSSIITVATTLLAMLISSAAGYGFVVYRHRIKEKIFKILLLSMMIPFAAVLIPLYRLFGQLGLLNNYMAIILPVIATAFLVFFFRQSAQAFPMELLEAGRVDGVSEAALFFKIFMPTMGSTYAAAAIITFMSSWNNYLWPLIVILDRERMTLPLVVSTLSSSYTPDYGVIMLAVMLSTLPTAIVFFSMQRYFVEGMLGGVK